MLVLLLLSAGVVLSVRCRGCQFYAWGRILRRTIGSLRQPGDPNRGALTQLQTCSAALAAAMGTGNLIGVAGALILGGPGAIFWMWVSALLGMALTYAENVLSKRYAYVRPDGTRIGGPMAYLHRGLHSPALAGFYGLCCIAASLGMGNMTQTAAIAALAWDAFGLPPIAVGLVTAALLALVILRGTRGVGGVIQWLMPILTAVYLLAAILVIGRHIGALPGAFAQIFRGAFGLDAMGGGICGAALKQAIQVGLRHGIFSNEAGLGSSALVHSAGDSDDGELQGLWSMVEVALDTLVCCTLTALAILVSGAFKPGLAPGQLLAAAFGTVFGPASAGLLAVATALFAFCTLIGWCCCGEQAVGYLFGNRGLVPYRVLFCLAAAAGAAVSLEQIWHLSDLANALMAAPNLLALVMLRRKVEKPQ